MLYTVIASRKHYFTEKWIAKALLTILAAGSQCSFVCSVILLQTLNSLVNITKDQDKMPKPTCAQGTRKISAGSDKTNKNNKTSSLRR